MTNVVSAERKPEQQQVDPKKVQPTMLGAAGAVLLLLSGFFLWRELSLASEVLAVAGSALAAAGAWLAHRKEKGHIGPIALGLATLGGGAWYAATKEPVLLIGLGMTFVASLVLTLLAQRDFKAELAKSHRSLAWLTTAVSGLVASFAAYFFVFDATESSLNEFIARRALLTLTWLVSGTVMVVMGTKKSADEIRNAGYLVLASSMAKLLLYDLGHTEGAVRIIALAVGGVVLMGASKVTGRFAKEKV